MMTAVRRWGWVGCVGVSLAQADWPQFRGPDGQGHATERGLPVEWSTERNVRWKTAVPGLGWSSPVVVGGRVYLTTAVGDGSQSGGLSLRVVCLDAGSGGVVWDKEVFGEGAAEAGAMHGKNSYASPTPVVEGGRIYVHFGHNGSACLDGTGKVLWRNTTLRYPPVHGSGGSPALEGERMIFSCDGASDPFVVALDKRTGAVSWRMKRESAAAKTFSFCTPLVIEAAGKRQLITPGSGVVSALDPKTGREIWRARYGQGYSVVPRPVYGHGMVFIGTGFDRPTVMAIRVDGTGDVTETHVAWTLTKGAPNTPSLLLVGDELYMVSDGGIASCVDARTGTVHWQERVGGNYSASPVYAEGRVYFQNEEGVGVVIKAGKTFERLASNVLREQTLASYGVDGGAFYIRTAGHLYRIQSTGVGR